MKENYELTALIEKEEDGYIALCPQLDIASQGSTIDDARKNLIEALELFFEIASTEEISNRFKNEILITKVNISV